MSPRSSSFSEKSSSSFLGLRAVLRDDGGDGPGRVGVGREGLVILLDLPSIERSVFGILFDGLCILVSHDILCT